MDTTEQLTIMVDRDVLRKLREYAQASGRSISLVVSGAVVEHLPRVELRPAFRSAADDVIRDHEGLIRDLAK
jgi:predicted transcriptional regulator